MKLHQRTIYHVFISLVVGIGAGAISDYILNPDDPSMSFLIGLCGTIATELFIIMLNHAEITKQVQSQKQCVQTAVAPMIKINELRVENAEYLEHAINKFADICGVAAIDPFDFSRGPVLHKAMEEMDELFSLSERGFAMSIGRAEAIYDQLAEKALGVFVWEPTAPKKSVEKLYSPKYKNLFLRNACNDRNTKTRFYVYSEDNSQKDVLQERTRYLKDICNFSVLSLPKSTHVSRNTNGLPSPQSYIIFKYPNSLYTLVSVVPFFPPYVESPSELDFSDAAGVFLRVFCYNSDNTHIDPSVDSIHNTIVAPLEKNNFSDFTFVHDC